VLSDLHKTQNLFVFVLFHVVDVNAVERLKMVDRLHVVLLSIVPTGAALVYLFWMYGWKKPKGTSGRHCQKPRVVEVTDADSKQSHDKVDATVISSAEQVLSSVNNVQDDPPEHDVCSGMYVSDDVSMSPESSSTDLKSPRGDKSLSPTGVSSELMSDLAVDVDSTGLVHDNDIVAAMNKCQSVNVNSSDATDEDEILKYPATDSQDNGAVILLEGDKCCNGYTANREVSSDKVMSEGVCVRNNVTNEGCENGRRDSIGSVRPLLSLILVIIQFGCAVVN